MEPRAGDRESLTGTRFTFQDIFQSLTCALRFEEVLDCILSVALRELEADEGSILLLVGEESRELKMLASRGLPEEIVKRGYVPRAGSPSERALLEQRPLILNGTLETAGTASREFQPRQIRSALCVPLLVSGRVLGTLNLNRTREGAPPFDDRDSRLGQMLASQAAMVIENHRLYEELQQRERLAALGEVVAGIAHCVKNMLAGLQGGLGLVKMGVESQNLDLADKGTEILTRSVAMLSNLMLDLLDLSKDRTPIREPFIVQEVLEYIADLLGTKAATMGVHLEVETKEAHFELWADRNQITRALLNLVLNAIEACGEDHSGQKALCVQVRAQRLGSEDFLLAPDELAKAPEWALFEVADNGPGIPPDVIPRLWDPFFSTKGSKGTGIGLAAVRKTVSEHGGKIHLDTEVGRGTKFMILIPNLKPAN